MRLFVSVDLPAEYAEAIADVQSTLADASGLSTTDPEQTHVTLKFLGEVAETRLSEVVELVRRGVADAAVEPFDCRIAGLGVFPSLEYISVVWLGVETGVAPLGQLHQALETRAVEAGFDAADNEFTPHVTIGRMHHGGGKQLVQETVEDEHPEIGAFTVETVQLKQSVLESDGPEYSTVATVKL
jgi:2'-5' RNA ligase